MQSKMSEQDRYWVIREQENGALLVLDRDKADRHMATYVDKQGMFVSTWICREVPQYHMDAIRVAVHKAIHNNV